MNKRQLVEAVSLRGSLRQSEAERAVDAVILTFYKELKAGHKINLVGFGSLRVIRRAARTGRNPQNGKPISIAEKRSVKFKVGLDLDKALNPPPKEKKKK